MVCQDLTSGFRTHTRGGNNLCSESLHDRTTVGLLVVTNLYHINGKFKSELTAGIRQSRSPLSGSCFGGYVCNTFVFAVPSLGKSGIKFVRANGTYAFVLEIYVCRRIKSLFESVSSYKRCASVAFVLLSNLIGNGNPRIRLVKFLL